MPKTGLEPARLAAHAPETCASTNSATWAFPSSLYFKMRAENETRTRDPNLGKVVLYQLSYFRKAHRLDEKVKRRRLELPRHNCHYPLKVARLPIPPSLHL